MAKKDKLKKKERGLGLSVWLIVLMLGSILTVLLILDLRNMGESVAMPFLLAGLFIFSVAKLVGLIALWRWERWGLYVYAVTVVGTMVIGLIMTGSLLIVFNDAIPPAILGWLLKDKYSYFE